MQVDAANYMGGRYQKRLDAYLTELYPTPSAFERR